MQNSQDKETSTEEYKQNTRKYKKKTLVGERVSTPVQTGPGAHVDSCTMVIQSLSQR